MKTFAVCCLWLFIAVSRKKTETGTAGSPAAPKPHHSSSAGSSNENVDDRVKSERKSEKARADQLEFSNRLKSAQALFRKKDIPATLAELGKASEIHQMHPEVLNLRGSCHVELRDFAEALKDFTAAAQKLPQNASIRFNLGEVHFVTKNWEKAIESFEQARQLTSPESKEIRELIDFKVMLCHAALGNADEFDRLAARNLSVAGTPGFYFTQASMEFRNHDPEKAGEILAMTSKNFPDARLCAPWRDTLVEFGWLR